jgi:hypothetical protein
VQGAEPLLIYVIGVEHATIGSLLEALAS